MAKLMGKFTAKFAAKFMAKFMAKCMAKLMANFPGKLSARLPAIVVAVLAFTPPTSAAPHGGGHIGGGGGSHPSVAFHASGPTHFSAPMSRGPVSFSHGPVITRSFVRPTFRPGITHSFAHSIYRGHLYRGNVYRGNRSISSLRYNHNHLAHVARFNSVSHVPNSNVHNSNVRNTNLSHSNFAVRRLRANTHLVAPATWTRIGPVGAMAWNWHSRGDWWRHRRGFFFGWAGPLYWPYFYDDLWYNVFWDYGPDYYDDPFWAYGYGDIYGAIFSPYGYDDLAGWAPPPPVRTGSIRTSSLRTGSIARTVPPASQAAPPGQAPQWSAMCGSDTQVVDLPIDKISAAVSPNDTQRAALDALANASVQAAQLIKAACPSDVAYTPTGRIDAMEHRVNAMVQAVALIRDLLDKFYDSLSDEQKARLNVVNHGDGNAPRAASSACGPNAPAIPAWPQAQIEKAVRPNAQQQALLDELKHAGVQAADMLKTTCPAAPPATPPARLAAVAKRLDVLLAAVKLVHAALNDFYVSLTDEQKAQFNGIAPVAQNAGPRR
ncbi:MAG TPA: Spy/CpxP family protein refolding chaperone [Xanthobacteraceae bacterium]|nr:Spy/CpxP family protein refolding chaperone [Xanthobacteraceae bacterium]